jgi:Domain of unknown function (DUF4337)
MNWGSDSAEAVSAKGEAFEAKEAEAASVEPVRLDVGVAVAVTIAAAFLAVCCVQAAAAVRTMSGLEVQIVEASAFAEIDPARAPAPAAAAQEDEAARAARLARFERRRTDVAARAKGLTADYDRLMGKNQQLDLAEVILSASIVVLGVTALVQKRWVFGLGVACALFGVAMGALGLCGVHLESAWLLRLARL